LPNKPGLIWQYGFEVSTLYNIVLVGRDNKWLGWIMFRHVKTKNLENQVDTKKQERGLSEDWVTLNRIAAI
jgi:hypothetical protein